ncbi:MAG: hypothetical protein LBJ47_09295 [Tannerella sp.]|nr:hypothetical protein [Tannerella sp.]
MSVENAGCTSKTVPEGTECGDCHIAYLTARGRGVAAAVSTNILSRRDRETGRPCPVRDKMSVENAGCTSKPVPSGTLCDNHHIPYLPGTRDSRCFNRFFTEKKPADNN